MELCLSPLITRSLYRVFRLRYKHYSAELHTLSVTYPLCGWAITNTMSNPSEKCPLKLTDFFLFLCHRLYTILEGLLISPMAFTICHDRGSNRVPPDGRASALTTQPLRLSSILVGLAKGYITLECLSVELVIYGQEVKRKYKRKNI